jgi:benzaldehyde dehydrogenase (NAD)
VVLELGGNNAFIVLDDADLDAAVNSAAWGSLLHQGQICMATGRHLVHRSLADEYVERLAKHAESLVVGNPTLPEVQIGPLITSAQADRVHGIVSDSIAAGAVLRTGGQQYGAFYTPTVLDHVRPATPAFAKEIFGPVIPVTRFDTDEEAVELAGASAYGLSAAIHTASLARGLELAARLRTGMVHINGQTIQDAAHIPMGGMGESGNGGRYGGHWNLDEFTYWQWVTARPLPPR